METFIPLTLYKASIEKDESKIITLGPIAKCLGDIIWHSKKKIRQQSLFTWRGMQLSPETI